MSEKERLFTAIELPEEIVEALVRHQPARGAGIRPARREQMHLTLYFIGKADTDAVHAALSRVQARRFEVTIAALGMFSRRGRPAALWAGVEHSDALLALHGAIGDALSADGFALESRPYRPHVTLARLKPDADREQIKPFLRGAAIDPLSFRVARFALIASSPGEQAREYETRACFGLE